MRFTNHDERIRYYPLLLERSLHGLPALSLPEGYRYVYYRPGDRDAWIDIERSAKEFSSYEEGIGAWYRYYGGKEERLLDRMVFVETLDGKKVATATAYDGMPGHGQSPYDPPGEGWLHWVAVRREYQGKGLSKPLIAYVLQVMAGHGHTHVSVPAQTTTWVACKIYLDLGFRPVPQNADSSRDGWRIVRALTGHKALKAFRPATAAEILAEGDDAGQAGAGKAGAGQAGAGKAGAGRAGAGKAGTGQAGAGKAGAGQAGAGKAGAGRAGAGQA